MLELKLASTGCYILSVLLLWHFCLLIPKMCVPVPPHTDLVLPVPPVISAEELSLVHNAGNTLGQPKGDAKSA